MRNCPFCGAEVKSTYPDLSYITKHDLWIFSHHCNLKNPDLTVCVNVYGKTFEEVLRRWNGHDENQKSESL